MTEQERLAAALAYQQAQQPARMNPNLAVQGARGRENMMPPTSIMDERYPAFKRNQEDVEKLMLGLDIVGSAIPLAGPAMKGAKILGQAAAPQIAQALENYTFKTGMALPMVERQAGRTFAAPQDEALRLAQERAALPVERGGLGLPPNNTAEQRAAAMGFDTPAYHATDADILAFNNAKLGTNTAYLTGGDEDAIKSAMRGHWFSDRDLTNKDPRGYMFGNVSYPVKLANPKVINDQEFGSKSFIVKDPDNIRSRFAAFDPFRRNAAIAAAMGVAAPDLLAKEKKK